MANRLRQSWMFVIALPALLLGGLDFYGSKLGETVFYPAVWLSAYTAGFAWIGIGLAAVALLAAWIVQLARRQPRAGWGWLPVVMALGGVPLACQAFLPLVASANEPAGSARLGGHVYRLMMHVGAVGVGAYGLYECDGLGLICRQHDMPLVGAANGDTTELIADEAAGTLTIKVNGVMAASFRVQSRPARPTPMATPVSERPPVTVTPAALTPAANGTPQAVAHVLISPPELIYSLAFSPDGHSLASAARDGQVVLWEVHD